MLKQVILISVVITKIQTISVIKSITMIVKSIQYTAHKSLIVLSVYNKLDLNFTLQFGSVGDTKTL